MVRRKRIRAGVLTGAVALAALAATAPAALSQDEDYYGMQEEARIEINAVGDARVTDTLTYDGRWFQEYGAVFDENPFLLSRRYREDSDVGEVENFHADIDMENSTVTLTFDAPGLVYNMGERWELYGYTYYDLADSGDGRLVLEAAWEGVNSEYTLWFDMYLDEKVVIDLPEGATGAGFDSEEGTVTYKLPYAPVERGGGNVLADNKILFSAVFALIMALSLLLFIFAVTRKPKEPLEALAAMGEPPVPPVSIPPAPQASAPPAPAPGMQEGPLFCRKCGHPRGAPGERFCRKCGNPHGQ